MKRLLLSAAITLTAFAAFADLAGDGYYRVQHAVTKRYAYLRNNKGSVDVGRGTADVKALKLFMDPELMISDPSCVFYIDCVKGEGSRIVSVDIAGQGTSLYSFFSAYVDIITGKKVDGQQTYYASASIGSFTKYLGDLEDDLSEDEGYADVDAKGDDRLWYIHPMDAASQDSYFGIKPTLTAGGKYYHPFYASFPFQAHSAGIKAYVVSKVDTWNKAVALREVKGTVPPGTPVIIECSNPLATDNRLDIGGTAPGIGDNRLKGVYFNNTKPLRHQNQTPYDRKTMRILTVKDGKLAFVTSDIQYLPANQAYLTLSGDKECAVESYQALPEEEYEELYGAVETISLDSTVDVYSLDGRLVKSGITREEASSLGKGMYVLRSGSSMEKLLIP